MEGDDEADDDDDEGEEVEVKNRPPSRPTAPPGPAVGADTRVQVIYKKI